MKTSDPIAPKILKRARHKGPGAVSTSADFLDLGNRAAVDQALSRLNRSGQLRRIKPGIYLYPAFSKMLNREVPPSSSEVTAAIVRKNGWAVQPSGAAAANALGISTQVPARVVLRTDGPSRTIDAGGWKIELKHTAPRFFLRGRQHSGQVMQALRWMGRDGVTQESIDHLRKILPPSAKKELRSDLTRAPLWLRPKLQQLLAN
jgi:hypothetical protein